MAGNRRDIAVALALIAFVAVMVVESFRIRRVVFSSLAAETWPLILLAALGALSLIYLVQAARGRVEPSEIDAIEAEGDPGLAAFVRRYANPAMCFAAFLAFLLTLPWLGMLLGGVAFVFVCLCLLGPRTPRATAVHLGVAVVSVAFVWGVFTYGLGVFLPQGEILGRP